MGLPQTPGKIQLVNNLDVILEQSIKEIVKRNVEQKSWTRKGKIANLYKILQWNNFTQFCLCLI